MTPDQYHQVLIGLDRALFVFHEAASEMTPDDEQLRMQIAIIRARILRAESGHPFPFDLPPGSAAVPDNDPDLTRAPFNIRRHDLS